jgi:hypothetical protein
LEVPKIGLSLASQVTTDMMSQQQKHTSSSDVSLTRVLPHLGPQLAPRPHHLELLSYVLYVDLVFGSIHFNTDICNIYNVHNIYVLLSLFYHQCSGRFVGTIGKKKS